MALKRPPSDMPDRSNDVGGGGLLPDPRPRYGTAVTDAEAKRPNKPIALGTPFRYSDAAACARRLAYSITGVEREPIDAAGLAVMRIGTIVHEDVQAAWQEVFGDTIEMEVPTSVAGITSGSCDGRITYSDPVGGDYVTILELKTKGGFGYKLAIGARGNAQGPSTPNIVQLALNVVGHDADEGVLIMQATEAISKGTRGFDDDDPTRFVAEWTFTREELQPYADREVERLSLIKKMVDDGTPVPRHVPYEMPPGARITDVKSASWVLERDGEVIDTGSLWGGKYCNYCPFQQHCSEVE